MRQGAGFAWVYVGTLLCATLGRAPLAAATTWSVTQFGANPNGSVDDTAAINAAINAAQSGDTVFFPAGVYDIANVITAKTGVALLGAGEGSTSIKSTAASGASNIMLNLGSASNVQVSNLTLNGNNNPNLGYGISGAGGSGENINNIAIANYPSNGISLWSVTNSTISNNQIFNGGGGVNLSGCSGVVTAGNAITRCTGGVGDAGGSNETIVNNTISIVNAPLQQYAAMYVRGSNMLVQGNVMNHWLSCDTYLADSAIRNNVITATDGTQSYAAIEMAGAANDDIFSGNVILGGQGNGFTETNNDLRQRLYYAHNTVRGVSTGMAAGWGGTFGENQQVYLYANTFAGNSGTGFGFGGGCQMFDFDSNVFSGNGNVGITFNSGTSPSLDKFRFVNNTITDNAGGGMTSLALSNQYFDSSNTVAGNGGANGNYTPASAGTFYNNMPTVSIVGSDSATVGAPVNFSSAFADSLGTPANYLWDLGDGLPLTTSTASFTYSEPGTYDVGLVVWDSLGRAAHDELQLTVTAASGAQFESAASALAPGPSNPVPEPSAAILAAVAGLAASACAARRRA